MPNPCVSSSSCRRSSLSGERFDDPTASMKVIRPNLIKALRHPAGDANVRNQKLRRKKACRIAAGFDSQEKSEAQLLEAAWLSRQTGSQWADRRRSEQLRREARSQRPRSPASKLPVRLPSLGHLDVQVELASARRCG